MSHDESDEVDEAFNHQPPDGLPFHVTGNRITWQSSGPNGPGWYYDDGEQYVAGDRPRPCVLCKRRPGPRGHDPCIENLPSVRFACCGHGVNEGYIAFSDGTVIRGHFTTVEDSGGVVRVRFPASIDYEED